MFFKKVLKRIVIPWKPYFGEHPVDNEVSRQTRGTFRRNKSRRLEKFRSIGQKTHHINTNFVKCMYTDDSFSHLKVTSSLGLATNPRSILDCKIGKNSSITNMA